MRFWNVLAKKVFSVIFQMKKLGSKAASTPVVTIQLYFIPDTLPITNWSLTLTILLFFSFHPCGMKSYILWLVSNLRKAGIFYLHTCHIVLIPFSLSLGRDKKKPPCLVQWIQTVKGSKYLWEVLRDRHCWRGARSLSVTLLTRGTFFLLNFVFSTYFSSSEFYNVLFLFTS